MSTGPITNYLNTVERDLRRGGATEHTHRPTLKSLIETTDPDVVALNEPARIECGAPDYRVGRDQSSGFVTVGHIEAKDVGADLSREARTEQLSRYRHALPNLVLTDYLSFRWYVGGEERLAARLARPTAGGVDVLDGGPEELETLLAAFLSHRPAAIDSAPELARRLARLTTLIHDLIVGAFEEDRASETLQGIRQAFQEVLMPDLSTSEFADMYAQTMSYGLFTARVHHQGGEPFRRPGAASEIPQTNPFLRRLFSTITGPDFDDEPYAPYVDDLVDLLDRADMDRVLVDFGKSTRREDPVVHFYETFLQEYDPALRERRGVYYTPEPIVGFIVDSVDQMLREHFDCPDGLGNASLVSYRTSDAENGTGEERTVPKVLILDPACGTGTFLYTVVDTIRRRFMERGDAGKWSAYVREQLLPRLYGFEILAAPYAVAHLNLGMQFAAQDLPPDERDTWAYNFDPAERLSVFLTNTLEEATKRSDLLIGRFISEEANAATEVKQDLPVLAVIGNPPYSNFGQMNRNDWILGLLDAYKEGLDEKKLNLDDDFIKFIRWGEWRVDQTGQGVLGFITNHTYLDGLVHRRMREHLMETFDEIYVLDLHGNLREGETPPGGGVEENVFGIQQGVAISLFVRYPEPSGRPARVHHAELWGDRASKFKTLEMNDVSSLAWDELDPEAPHFFFSPWEGRNEEYEQYWSATDAVYHYGSGVKTDRDKLFVDFDRDVLAERMKSFFTSAALKQPFKDKFRVHDTSSYPLLSRRDRYSFDEDALHTFLYRAFDRRWVYYQPGLTSRPAWKVSQHMLAGDNLALVLPRQVKTEFRHALVVEEMVNHNILDTAGKFGAGYLFPLYLYDTEGLFSGEDGGDVRRAERRPNLTGEFLGHVAEQTGLEVLPDGSGDLEATVGPEDVLAYLYAVLHSPTYRARYQDQLQVAYPRFPVTDRMELFAELVRLGRELIDLHLLRFGTSASTLRTRYPVPGSDEVASGFPRYLPPGGDLPRGDGVVEEGRVYVNDGFGGRHAPQYVAGVPQQAWERQVGGYQVLDKWLSDRKGETLGHAEVTYYQQLVEVFAETPRLMERVDRSIQDTGGWPIA